MRLLVFLHSGDDARLRSAASLIAAAAALGRPVTVVWEGAALRRLAADDLGAPGPAGLPPVAEMIAEARLLGGVRLLACPTAVLAAGLTETDVAGRVDAVTGLATILEDAGEAQTLYV